MLGTHIPLILLQPQCQLYQRTRSLAFTLSEQLSQIFWVEKTYHKSNLATMTDKHLLLQSYDIQLVEGNTPIDTTVYLKPVYYNYTHGYRMGLTMNKELVLSIKVNTIPIMNVHSSSCLISQSSCSIAQMIMYERTNEQQEIHSLLLETKSALNVAKHKLKITQVQTLH